MLVVDIRALHEGPVRTEGQVAADDPLLHDVPVRLDGVVDVSGVLATTGRGRHFWRAEVHAVAVAECRRCLAPLRVPIRQAVEALFTADPDVEDDPSVYPIDPRATEVDVRPAVREELILAAPEYPLCREDCRGLCPRCGADLNAGPCGCRAGHDSRWGALLAHKPPETES